MIYVSLTKNEEEKNIVLVVWMFMVSPKENSKLAHSRTQVQRESFYSINPSVGSYKLLLRISVCLVRIGGILL